MKRKKVFTHFIKMYGKNKGKNLGTYGDFGQLCLDSFSKLSKPDQITNMVFLQNEKELENARNLTGLALKI